MPTVAFACPDCATPLDTMLACPNCGRAFALRDDIYRFLLPEREQALAAFVAQYRRVREQDGYRSRSAAYYQSLPHVPPDDPQAPVWRIRAATYRTLKRTALRRPASAAQRLTVLDLGAGNAWLCNRLDALGHECVAVDWLDDEDDGLGAAKHYETSIIRAQADFDRLPFVPGQFDLVVYNGSLHYSPDIEASLGHGVSMLRPHGILAIMDSPMFRSKASAERMLAEQAQRFAQGGQMAEVIRPGQGYLLAGDLLEAGHRLGIELRFTPSRGDPGWALRRQLAGFKLRREPAGFGLWLGVRRSAKSRSLPRFRSG